MQGRSKGIREDIILLRSKGQYSSANLISDGYRDELINTAEFLSFSLRERILKSAQWFESQPPKSDFISSEETVGRTPIKCWYIQLPWIWKFIVFRWANQIEKPNLGRFNTAETKPVFVSKRYAYTCSYKLFRLRKYTILQKEFQTPEPVVHTCHLIRWATRLAEEAVCTFGFCLFRREKKIDEEHLRLPIVPVQPLSDRIIFVGRKLRACSCRLQS